MTMTEMEDSRVGECKKTSTCGRGKTARIVVLGETGVGKTALIVRCLTKRFLPEYISRRDSSDLFRTRLEGETLNLELVDCNNQEERLTASGDAFVLVYSVVSRNSMKRLGEKIELIRRAHGEDVPIAVVANKRDLAQFRSVSTVEGIEFANDNKAAFFCELSVANDFDVIPQIFIELYKILDTKRKLSPATRRSKQKVSKMFDNFKGMVKRTNSR